MMTQWPSKPDRRVEKTRQAIHQALMALIREKSYDLITIQELLDRANVGRSTFYSHYRDKDDLLVASLGFLREMLSGQFGKEEEGSGSRVISFSGTFFAHARENQDTYKHLVGSQSGFIVVNEMTRVVYSIIEERLKEEMKALGLKAVVPPNLLCHALSTLLMSVMEWWLDRNDQLPPSQIEAYFQTLAQPMLAHGLGRVSAGG